MNIEFHRELVAEHRTYSHSLPYSYAFSL